MVLSTSIPADVYMGRQLAKLMAIVGAINGIAPALGPVIGGFMADSVGWKGIFIVLLAVEVIMTFWTTHYTETFPRRSTFRPQISRGISRFTRLFCSTDVSCST